MNKISRNIVACSLAVLAAVYAFYIANIPRFTPEASLQWAKIPPQVRERIVVHAGGGEIKDINSGIAHNKAYYRATSITPEGQEVIIKVEETGKLIGLRYSGDEGMDCKSEGFQVSPTR